MSASALLDRAAILSDQIAECDERVASLRKEIQSFLGTDPDSAPLALPADWDVDRANEELSDLLKQRHRANAEYRQLCEQHERERTAEIERKLSALKAEYRGAVAALLRASIAFATAVSDAHNLRMQARDLSGRMGDLRHVGPVCDGHNPWNLSDPYSLPSIWARESKEYGLISGDEPWLAGVDMTGAIHQRVR